MKLKKYKLYEIADLNKSSISNSDNTLSEIIYLDTSSITENVILGTCKMSIHEAPSRAQRRVKKNTILYSTVRPRLKHYGILSSPEANLIVSTGFVTIDVKSEFQNSVDARFLFLLLTQPHITEYIASIADSAVSAYPSFNPSDISALEFEFPEMNIQTHIADIWKYYDSKIELNRQINDNLEAMAKLLYDYWFVQFDFPNEEGRPYKSSGGAMVWNDKLKREIPKGWTSAKIKDAAHTYSGGTPTSTNSKYYDGGNIPWINSGELNNPIITSTTNYITEEGLNNSSAKLYPQDTVLVALYGATAGKVSLLSFEACSNQAVCGVIPQNKIMTTYIRYYLSSLYEHFITLSSGSARDNISQDTIKNTILPIPQEKILKEYSDSVVPIISKIIANQKEIENLTKQRDELLPLLMNGQATVNYHLSDD